MSTGERLLEVKGVSVQFEGLTALRAVDLSLAPGEIVGLIGPNGAGKTTLVNVLSGFQNPAEGKVLLGGVDVTRWTPFQLCRAGIGRTFQAVRLFANFTVEQNIELAGVGAGLSRHKAREQTRDLLARLDMGDKSEAMATALSYGEERWVGVARALAGNPKFLLLDEPAAGLNPAEAASLIDRISAIRRDFGCGILIIEHNMPLIMGLCDRIQVLAQGQTIARGTPSEIRSDQSVRQAYLGSESRSPAFRARPPSPSVSPAPLLSVSELHVAFGAVRALRGVSIEVRRGEFVSVIGPNGAGKSTLMNAILGLVRAQQGCIQFAGEILDRQAVEARVEAGLALVPEGRRIFGALTVAENLEIGATTRHRRDKTGFDIGHVLDYFPILRERLRSPAGKLSGGEQQQLAIARALLSSPQLLLLDEPSLGLAPLIIDQVYEILARLNRDGSSVLLIEQNATRALAASDRTYVLRNGVIELAGRSTELIDDPRFDHAYFGFVPEKAAAL